MPARAQLPRAFFDRPTIQVARELLGSYLIHAGSGPRVGGLITETEAYCGVSDLGAHARAGRTPRTEVMYGPPGHAYVYFTYGMHWLFNTVTCPEGVPEAVLIRAILPTEGIDLIAQRRGRLPRKHWTDGPAKLTQALGIGKEYNNLDFVAHDSPIRIEKGESIPAKNVIRGPRVGLNTVPEPWKSKPWRFRVKEIGHA